jgi:cytochrome c oxidase cbb3-type subunit II
MAFQHTQIEKNIGLMMILIVVMISIGGIVQIIPLFFMESTTEPVEGLEPYSALELSGRDIYVREGCYLCHSQMIRPFRAEVERYGHYSLAGEFVYDRPFQWGSKRTGPDLHRVGGRYSDEWHRVHLVNPRDVVPESIMPGYPWLETDMLDTSNIKTKMTVLRNLGAPYKDEEIENAPASIEGKTEMDAMIAYLQKLGTAVKTRR